jgi:hypothetical protein
MLTPNGTVMIKYIMGWDRRVVRILRDFYKELGCSKRMEDNIKIYPYNYI